MNNWYQAELTVQLIPRMLREGPETLIKSPGDVLTLMGDLRLSTQEVFAVITLNTKNRMIGRHVITIGIADGSLAHPREVFRRAIMDNAVALVLVHNHPSGDTTPSTQDLHVTRQLVEAGKIIGIQVLDHVIVGDDTAGAPKALSLRESGLIQFGV